MWENADQNKYEYGHFFAVNGLKVFQNSFGAFKYFSNFSKNNNNNNDDDYNAKSKL